MNITISEHCIGRYLERVAPPRIKHSRDRRRLAKMELLLALQGEHLCTLPCGEGVLVGVTNPAGFRFMVKLDSNATTVETCGPIWFWHEARRYWKAHGVDMSRVSKGKKKPGAGFLARQKEREDAEKA
jgi:ferredoxin-NADP reductase